MRAIFPKVLAFALFIYKLKLARPFTFKSTGPCSKRSLAGWLEQSEKSNRTSIKLWSDLLFPLVTQSTNRTKLTLIQIFGQKLDRCDTLFVALFVSVRLLLRSSKGGKLENKSRNWHMLKEFCARTLTAHSWNLWKAFQNWYIYCLQ